MRIPIKCFLFFLVTFNSAFGQKNFIQNLDSLCIVTFPDTPKVKSSGINTGYFISNKKERYIAMVQTFDKATINDFKDQLPSFYEGVIKGVLETSNTKGTLIYKKNIIMDGIQGIDLNTNPPLIHKYLTQDSRD